jgi:hypothetical protein
MRRTTRRQAVRRTAAATIAVLALGGLAACNDGGDSTATDPAAADTSSPAAGDTSAPSLSAGDDVDPADFVKAVTDGVENSTTAHLTMTIDTGAAGTMKAEGDLDYTTTPPNMAMTMTLPVAGSGEMDVRLVDGVMYLSMGQITQGKFWKIDPSDPKGPMASLGLDKLMDQMDPAHTLAALQDGISKVTYVGAEDGLDHYQLTVDMKKAMDAMGSSLPPGAASQLPDSLAYDVWLDDQGRFAKMRMDDLPTGGATPGSMEMSTSGWGEDVDIAAPPADQVTEMPDMGSMMQDSGARA